MSAYDVHNIHRYDAESFLTAAEEAPRGTWGSSWCGGLGATATLHNARYGDDSNVPKAQELLDKLSGNVETPRQRWEPEVCGGYVIVPEAIVGLPACMRQRRRNNDVSNPINVYVSIMAAGGVDADRMMKRGIAVLALVLKLQAVRPIELFAVCPWVNSTIVIRIPTRPISIAHAAFALSHPAYFRRLGHDVLMATGDCCTTMEADEVVPKRLGMRPADLYVGTGVSSLDWNGGTATKYQNMLTDPVAWINEQLKRLAGGNRN